METLLGVTDEVKKLQEHNFENLTDMVARHGSRRRRRDSEDASARRQSGFVTNLEQIISQGNSACKRPARRPHIAKSMLRTALRRARPASSVAPRRGIASGLNLLELSTSDLQLARTWDAAEADGVNAASGGAPSPPSPLFSVE